MEKSSDSIDLSDLLRSHYLLHPSTLALLAANMVPLVGVFFWHWDAFLLLMLYWMETAVVAFWALARIAATPVAALTELRISSSGKTVTSRRAIIGFFAMHAGLFMLVHFLFLWTMLSGTWARKVHGVGDFILLIVLGSGLWVPLIALFLGRGVTFLFHVPKPDLLGQIEHALFPDRPIPPATSISSPGVELVMLYVRIIVMQFVIVIGGGLSMLLGTMAPFVLFILFKTAIDLIMHIVLDFGGDVLNGKIKIQVATR